MEEKTFSYQYLEFKPIRQFTEEEEKRSWKGDLLNFEKWFSHRGYSYSDFYEKAKKIGAEDIDIFEIRTGILKGVFAVPCRNYIALITDKKIIGYDNSFRFEVAKKCAELYKELYNSEEDLFRAYPRVQIYWNNKYGYELEILVDFDEKTLISKVDNTVIDVKKFNDFFYFKEFLENKNIKILQEEYSDKKITDKVASSVLRGNVVLNDLSKTKQYTYIYFLYKYILYNLYSDRDIVNYKMLDFFEDEFVVVENKTIEVILKEIRDDILNQIKKDINFLLFDDMYYGE